MKPITLITSGTIPDTSLTAYRCVLLSHTASIQILLFASMNAAELMRGLRCWGGFEIYLAWDY